MACRPLCVAGVKEPWSVSAAAWKGSEGIYIYTYTCKLDCLGTPLSLLTYMQKLLRELFRWPSGRCALREAGEGDVWFIAAFVPSDRGPFGCAGAMLDRC